MRVAISGHHGSPITSNHWFLPFECVPCGIGHRASRRHGHRAVVGITPSFAERAM